MGEIATDREGQQRFDRETNPLSAREWEILERVSHGQDGPEIAADLVVSPATVRTHIGNAIRKLGARSRAHAVAIALRQGLLE
ncbi:MAG: Two-component transcriptional response regulator, LuxR family [uncultured Solirubrobacteraceae bacterium]|uniref:Two-component transcriptional response regulator, LuxR family n=1 Tax=uncultured Solirubrobacteraceae bacterium TaxID=1162706 RepID=A0A6J4TK60_9ACTN|nr:MAG: Two-component transcriptional response regulator, LuxR family [uncultured Solirubrobacteraceae bacterium]